MILDVVDNFTAEALRIRDDVDMKNLDDADYKDRMGKLFLSSAVTLIFSFGDGLLEIANRDNR